jgi:predicted RNase H-like HicB family nuclease
MADYAVTLARRYDGLFTATFVDVPEAIAYGRDEEEALEEAAKSLDAALHGRLQRGEAAPAPQATGPLVIPARTSALV